MLEMEMKAGAKYEEFVASVIRVMEPTADVKYSQWIHGPDGIRDMDVVVRGKVDSIERVILIECKDYDPSKTGKVGIGVVDALDSKRVDLGADAALICSNAGFTGDAIRKAKRKRIGLVSVLKRNDPRVKAQVLEEIYYRRIRLGDVNVSLRTRKPYSVRMENVLYNGLPIVNWVILRACNIATINPTFSGRVIRATHTFISPLEMEFSGELVNVDGLDFEFAPVTTWYAHTVRIDASLGLYDYVRGQVRLAGENPQFITEGVDFDAGTLIDFVPTLRDLQIGLLPGEVEIGLLLIEDGGDGGGPNVPQLDSLIVSEDLDYIIP